MHSLPVHFFTIVLNGEPFIRHHIEQFKQLPFDWHWHVIEGAAALKHDTAWSLRHGGRLPPDAHRNGLSVDGTTAYLDQILKDYPKQITVYQKEGLWEGKREMVSQPLGRISQEALLWEIDADELWTADQFIRGRQLFIDHPEKTAAFYWCWFFVGPDRVLITRGGYGNNPKMEWLRTWRYRPGMAWAAHEPPVLAEQIGDNQWRDVGRVNPFTHEETERAGLVFQHYGYVTLEQVRFKENYYGYSQAVGRWAQIQYQKNLPLRLGDYFPWVGDDTLVGAASQVVPNLLYRGSLTTTLPAGEPVPSPLIVVDGIFFQFGLTGIARVWWSILSEWTRTGFARNVLILDRAGTFPPLAGVRRRLLPHHDYATYEADRALLQEVCDEEGAGSFVSTYYTTPLRTPSVLLVHDMIPELFGYDLNEPMWKEKQAALQYASAWVTVSNNTKRDLLKHLPHIAPESEMVAHPGVWPIFSPALADQVKDFLGRAGMKKPYFLTVGLRDKYKNTALLFDAIKHLPNPGDFQILSLGDPRDPQPQHVSLVQAGILRLLDRVDDHLLACAYSGALALVYPSLYEGFGLPIIEAFACGCPVITTALGSIPEVAGDAALYIDPHDPAQLADALIRIQQPEVRNPLIQHGFERVKQFRWEAMAQTLADLLLKVAGTPQQA
jgi:glycosyltransferase involved in cell wall biosynthesis